MRALPTFKTFSSRRNIWKLRTSCNTIITIKPNDPIPTFLRRMITKERERERESCFTESMEKQPQRRIVSKRSPRWLSIRSSFVICQRRGGQPRGVIARLRAARLPRFPFFQRERRNDSRRSIHLTR